MHAENCPLKLDGYEVSSMHSGINVSILEEDLAISSSTYGITDKTSEEPESEYVPYKSIPTQVVYLNEDTMDCSYAESNGTPKSKKSFNNEVSSPELFASDDEDQNPNISSRKFLRIHTQAAFTVPNPKTATTEELVDKSDRFLLSRINTFLSGIPPPPKHTICQSDCTDFLTQIRQNRQYFVLDPLKDNIETNENTFEAVNDKISVSRARSLRNLTTAFDACDQSNPTEPTNSERSNSTEISDNCCSSIQTSSTDTSEETQSNRINLTESELSISSITTSAPSISMDLLHPRDKIKHVTFNVPVDEHLASYCSVSHEEAASLPWPLIYPHKAHGIYYNRSRSVEEFESLSLKLCQRYIGNETQSTCTSWFTKQAPGSAKKRTLLGKRAVGQSPGKRLSHLARRRRTFSSANLLGMAEKKQLVLNVKKPTIKKGKSPRGKSPRGKSPRGSAKKRLTRRLTLDGVSPRKSKIETSKRALFQSPPNDKAGPSRINQINISNPTQKIKRALFPTPKQEDVIGGGEESRKRKSDEELEGPRIKWAKSLSFDCHSLDKSKDGWGDKSISKGDIGSSKPIKSELSEVNRKKLLWAVSEALRSRGISMGHPKFKQYATQLARTVKKYMPDLENKSAPRKPGSTSDRMLKLAKNHVILIVETKSD